MNPFIKVTWQDVPENFTAEKIRRVKTYFEQKYNSKNVKIITKTLSNVQNTRLESLEVTDSILDNQYQKNLMKDFIKDNSIDVKWELVDRLDNRVNGEIDKLNQNKVRYNRWFVKKVEFSNFLSFGENNGFILTKGPKSLLIEGFNDLTSGDTDCIINEVVFSCIGLNGVSCKSVSKVNVSAGANALPKYVLFG